MIYEGDLHDVRELIVIATVEGEPTIAYVGCPCITCRNATADLLVRLVTQIRSDKEVYTCWSVDEA